MFFSAFNDQYFALILHKATKVKLFKTNEPSNELHMNLNDTRFILTKQIYNSLHV